WEGERRGDATAEGGELVMPAGEGGLKREASSGPPDVIRRARQSSSAPARRAGARRSTPAGRGRYSGATAESKGARAVALDATLRAAAPAHAFKRRGLPGVAHALAPEDLRFKRYTAKAGTLYVFLVDASGSMAANRAGQAKGALAQLLRRSYVNRDRVSLISFRGRDAELVLAPSSSASRARRLLDELAVGGATPLSAGLLRALDVSRRANESGTRRVRLIVFTDGRANVALAGGVTADGPAFKERIRDEIRRLGAALCGAGGSSLVVDTRSRFTSNGEGRYLSEALGGRYVQLPQLISEGELPNAFEGQAGQYRPR